MKKHSLSITRPFTILLTGAVLLLATTAHGYKRIYVHTDAEETYLAQRSPDQPESYYFFEGIFFGGYIRDDGLGAIKFIDIAKGLAPNLAKQDYWPATSKETCDLLLVVSWGTTNPGYHGDVSNRLLPDSFDGPYYDELAEGAYDESEFRWFGKQRNSKLIGFWPYLRRDRFSGISPSEEYELRSALQTERYFMIVTAFDFQALMNKKQWNRVWSTRFSVRSPGISWPDAHLALSKAGAPYFGKKMRFLGKERADAEPVIGDVKIGEIEILETLDVPRGQGMLNSLRMPDNRR